LQSDHGAGFNDIDVKKLCKHYNVQFIMGAVRHPQS